MDDATYIKELERRIANDAKVIQALSGTEQTKRLTDLALEIVAYCAKIDRLKERLT